MSWSAVVVVALVAGAFLLFAVGFALSVALVSAGALSRVTLRRLAGESNGTYRFLEEMRWFASSYRLAAQFVRQGCLVGGVVIVTQLARLAGWPRAWAIGTLFTLVVGVVLLELLLARWIAARRARGALRRLAPLLRATRALAFPLARPVSALLILADRDEGSGEEESKEEQEEEVEAYLEVGEREGILEAEEGKMVRGVVDLGDTLVREIMTPRPDIRSIPVDTTVGDARRALQEMSHSRMPVFREEIDDIVGILHLRDLVRAWEDGSDDDPIAPYLRTAFFVPETQTASDLLARLRKRTNMALVVDEYGGIAGLVTMEDILEEIVGDIRDEHDSEEEQIREGPDGCWLFSGLVHVQELEKMFGVEFPERDFDTVGGLVISLAGKVPIEGDEVICDGIQITVVKADPRRVYQVRIRGELTASSRGEQS